MMKSVLCIMAVGLMAGIVWGETTGAAGASQPFSTVQPTLAINYYMPLSTTYDHLGDIGMFAGTFGPNGSALVQGQLLAVSQNDELFSKLGAIYGGDGRTTFALPDLRGRVPVAAGTGAGLSTWMLGERGGTEDVTLSMINLPAHDHTLPPTTQMTDPTGAGLPYTNLQPSLGLNYMIALDGLFPSSSSGGNGGGIDQPFIGQVVPTAQTTAPQGWALAQGQLLPINQNQTLYSILGTRYGGDGRTTFALPDLRGRAVIGAGQGSGLSNHPLGERMGVEELSMSLLELPAHDHPLPPSSDLTGTTGGSQPQTNMQPTLALNYIVATVGIYPSRDGGGGVYGDEPFIGQISLFAGNYAPAGWEICDGQLVSVASNTELFSLLGTTYGGDGRTTFALPDLRGRIAVNAGQAPGLSYWRLSEEGGVEMLTLSEVQMAAHTHDYTPVPEPATIALFGIGALGTMIIRRRSR